MIRNCIFKKPFNWINYSVVWVILLVSSCEKPFESENNLKQINVSEKSYVNIKILREDLITEVEKFVDELYSNNQIMKEVNGVVVYILKLTDEDLAISLSYNETTCSEKLIGITDIKYLGKTVYLMSWDGRISEDFFEMIYPVKCVELEDYSTIINDTHLIPYYEMLRNIPSKILYYQNNNGNYEFKRYYLNEKDIPNYFEYYHRLKDKK